jgi:hypothetical protein
MAIEKSRTHVFKIPNTTTTICEANWGESSSWLAVSLCII